MMNRYTKVLLVVVLFSVLLKTTYSGDVDLTLCVPGFNQEFKLLHSSESINPCEKFTDRPLLIVNTASHCGFTPQFEMLEEIHQAYADKGLVVIGVPSNDFNQESSSEAKTEEVCRINYGVTFTMFSPQTAKGENAHPVFRYLASETNAPLWNFTKYLVSKERKVTHRFGSHIKPDSRPLPDAIETLL
jgi:glutathione peroxidase